mgnify:CR=1 FL=1
MSGPLPRCQDHAPAVSDVAAVQGPLEQGEEGWGPSRAEIVPRPEHRTDAVFKTGAGWIEGSHPLPILQGQTRQPILRLGRKIREPVQVTPPVCMEIE